MNDNAILWLTIGLAVGWYFGKGTVKPADPCDCSKPSDKGVGGMVATGKIADKACARC
jgi:hypothetical protein